jgi:hypothetical protein
MTEMTEHEVQRDLVKWCREVYPWVILFSIPNGGQRNIVTARRLKEEGVLPGVPDLFLAKPVGHYAGLFLEIKKIGGRISKAQQQMTVKLAKAGYAVRVPRGLEEGKKAIQDYLNEGI